MFNDILQIPLDRQLWYLALFAWVVVWKGLALWRAAQKEQKWWFIALLVVNTLGILEILYVYVFSVERPKARAEEAKTE
ncbi:MAG: hypothetical protein IT406_03715 [Candidatus Yanofskybacteria bacterium]|nr:hypothetical protein [Candidatus Yanofskybacteria bacterium]